MKYSYIIYKLTFPNTKVYIGQTVLNFNAKMSWYKSVAYYVNGKDYNRLINKAIRKYGWDNIKQEIIYTVSEEFVDDAERYFIKKYNSNSRNFGYNLEDGGNENKHLSEETKKLISKIKIETGIHKGVNNSMFGVHRFGEDSPMYGKTHSEKSKSKISIANTGRKRTEYTKKIMSEFRKGKFAGEKNPMFGVCGKDSPMYGKKHSEETKKRISKLKQGQGSKSIIAYDIFSNDYIGTFDSVKQASQELTLVATHISRVLKNKRKSTGGYTFKYNIGNVSWQ